MKASFTVRKLDWKDEALGTIDLPERPMEIRAGFGSGLAVRAGDPSGTIWAVGDRGPNLKIKTAVELYGLKQLEELGHANGAKVMPRPDLGPTLAELRVHPDRVELVRTIRLTDKDGNPVSGLPVPQGEHARCEPAIDLDGNLIEPDPSGLDTEGLIALAGGGFWVGDEFGPSLVHLDDEGKVLKRLVPEGIALDATYPVEANLPAIAARRQLNRGFEAIALSADEAWLFLAFQSPLAHPDEEAHEAGRHVRLWRLDAANGRIAAQYLYSLDAPESFLRDRAKDEGFGRSDIKVSEIICAGKDALLVLERGSETTKIYRVTLDEALALPSEHLDPATRPTVEQLSAQPDGPGLPLLPKQLLLTTDEAPQVAADLEGMAILSPTALLLVNDNDFGVEGAETSFWRIDFDEPVLA